MTDQDSTDNGLRSVTPATRKRLQQLFERANRLMGQADHDYAHELFSQCVIADPGNVVYTQTCLANLIQKHGGKKKTSMFGAFKGLGSKGGAKKAALKKDWLGVVKSGLEVLSKNPWDTSTFLSMAEACEHLGLRESQMVYLRAALKFNPEDLHINRLCAAAFREHRDYAGALACWQRVLKARPDDEEANRTIAQIAAEQTIDKGGYEKAESSRDVKRTPTSTAGIQREELTPEQQLLRQIQKQPDHKAAYVELAQLYLRIDQYQPAEEILAKARKQFPDDIEILEKFDEVQLRNLREAAIAAEKEAQETGSADAKQKSDALQKELENKELEHYEHLVERFPSNLNYRFRLGQRYQAAGRLSDAIQQFQQARNDPKHHGLCQLELGRCFQQIKQYKLAADHYANAIREISDQDEKNKKEALYLAAKLALGLKDFDAAEAHAHALAAMDFGYKDLAALLDKIAESRQD